MSRDPDCLFCKIVAGEVPGDVVRETKTTVALRDIEPQAPTHVLVIPKDHLVDAAAIVATAPDVMTTMLSEATAIAEAEQLAGYRLVMNTGREGGQAVFHAHLHILGGRQMSWPPG